LLIRNLPLLITFCQLEINFLILNLYGLLCGHVNTLLLIVIELNITILKAQLIFFFCELAHLMFGYGTFQAEYKHFLNLKKNVKMQLYLNYAMNDEF